MLISLCVMSGVFAIVAHQASTQTRLYAGIQQTTLAREHRAQASAIGSRLLWSIAPQAGDVTIALDSALQIEMPIGTSVVCHSAAGSVTIAAPATGRGAAVAAFSDPPEPGDRMAVLFHDSLGTTWLTVRLASAPSGAPCPRFPASPGWQLALVEPIQLPDGAALRLMRPLRLSLYRASDSRWYLGAKEWNGAQQRFNTIQPIAGPYAPRDPDPLASGFAFLYLDHSGEELSSPVDASRIAAIRIVARSVSGLAHDSGAVTISLRNAR